MQFSKIKNTIFISAALILGIFLTGCVATGSTLRSARLLDQGQFELSGGVSGIENSIAVVGIAAYGITDNIEVEARYEDDYIALTPRVQILSSKTSILDCAAFFELGYDFDSRFQWGPGVMIGRRFEIFDPYVSYRFRHNTFFSASEEDSFFKDDFFVKNVHYVKVGCRFYPSSFQYQTNKGTAKWFIGAEAGPTFVGSGAVFEWAANIGVNF